MPDGARVQIEPTLMQQYYRVLSADEGFGQLIHNTLIALTLDENGIQLYNISGELENPIPSSRPYLTAGSGADMADIELYNFFEDMPRDQRQYIDPIEGIAALLNATESASKRNVGVAGTPSIGIFIESNLTSPGENNSRLAAEIVKGVKKGVLPKNFEKESLIKLILENGDFHEVERQMWQEANNETALSRLLRGYKV